MNPLISRAISVNERLSLGYIIRQFRVSSQNMVIAVSFVSLVLKNNDINYMILSLQLLQLMYKYIKIL